MSIPIFTEAWALAWSEELNASSTYREAARTWEGPVVLVLDAGDAGERAVFVDLWHGECRTAREAEDNDHDLAEIVIRGDLATWRRVLERDLDPVFGLMSGRLRLTKGSMSRMMPYVEASKELVAAATRIATLLPDA